MARVYLRVRLDRRANYASLLKVGLALLFPFLIADAFPLQSPPSPLSLPPSPMLAFITLFLSSPLLSSPEPFSLLTHLFPHPKWWRRREESGFSPPPPGSVLKVPYIREDSGECIVMCVCEGHWSGEMSSLVGVYY